MPRAEVRARAAIGLFQCVIYDSNSTKRVIAVAACGDDVKWAPNFFGLFDRNIAASAPKWLRDQIMSLPADIADLDFRGQPLDGSQPVAGDGRAVVHMKEGEHLGDESAIPQGG
jgi:hypothetical protein